MRSLCWRGDELVDWVSGGDAWTLDGRFVPARLSWGYARFDAAEADPTGQWAVVHERTGTAAILVRQGRLVRELHRSPYHADAYEYPVCLFAHGGRTILAHCPDSYARLELDDAETGQRLTPSDTREPPDYFHSRLAASPGGTRLASAGWLWHPLDSVRHVDVAAALADPAALDRVAEAPLSRHVCLAEESSAAWLDDDRLVLGAGVESEDPEEAAEADRDHPGPRLRPSSLAVLDVTTNRYGPVVDLGYPPGHMMRVGTAHVLTLFGHPRLVSLASRTVVAAWPDLATGEVVSSIVYQRPYPVLARDPAGARLAVAGPGRIDVLTFDPAALP